MTTTSFPSGRALLGACAVSLALGAVATPALADHGQVARGVILGLATGVAIDELSNNYYRPHYYYTRPAYTYAEPTYYSQPTYYSAPVYTAPATASPLAMAFDSQDPQLRMSIQYNLMQQGFYNSTIDGVWGPATENALYGYARGHNDLAMLTTEDAANQLFSEILH